jgi:ribonuclease Z
MAFSLTILGSSSALPTTLRNTTAQVLNIQERFFLIDCGEGTQIQLRKFKIKFGKINHIFISHLHGDHILGLFGLISSYILFSRKTDLHIYCDKELENILYNHLKYFDGDFGFNIIYHFLNSSISELIYDDDLIQVITIPLNHRLPCSGFLFKEKPKPLKIQKEQIQKYNIPIKEIKSIKDGEDYISPDGEIIKNNELTFPPESARSYAFCSDTIYNESIIEYIREVDLLYHEATFKHDMLKRAMETFHTTALQAATLAKKANVKKLIIGHFSVRYKNIEPLLTEAKSVFENTVAAEDGMRVDV